MKKKLSVLLAFVLLFCAVCPAFAAENAADMPAAEGEVVILVPGVVESMLIFDGGENAGRRFFDPAGDWLKNRDNLMGLIRGALLAMFLGRNDRLDSSLLALNAAAVGGLAMNPDGTSKYPIRTYISGAEESSMAALMANGTWKHVDFGAMLGLTLAEQAGADNVFVFCYDWRLGSTQLAGQLRDFIGEVRALTGKTKVNLYGNSYGCQVIGKYLMDHSGEGAVSRVVFNAPAWTGTPLFKALMAQKEEDLVLNLTDGADLLMHFLMYEYDFTPVIRLFPKRLARHAMFVLVKKTIDDALLYAPGLWCCCAAADYEEMKALLLDPVRNAALIEITDEAQYGIMSHVPDMLRQAEADGVRVAITMSDGLRLFAGENICGDGVVDAASASGGEAVPFGRAFSPARAGAHVSPTNALDLTNAYLPDRTWVTSGQSHGQTYWDDYTAALIPKLLLTDELETVFSDPAFPQFADSMSPGCDVVLRLTDTAAKILDPGAGKVQAEITNLSEQNTVYLTGVTVCGLPYVAGIAVAALKPGETARVTLFPLHGEAGPCYGTITVHYFKTGLLPQEKSRVEAFRIGA